MKRKLFIFLLIFTFIFTISIEGAFADTATVNVSVSDKVTVGSSVTFTVKFSGSKLYAANTEITYDPNLLEYSSSTAAQVNGDGGTLKVLYEGDTSGASEISFKLVFKTKKTGKATVTVNPMEICDSTGDDTIKASSKSATVSIVDKAASNDANLKSLSVSSGTLSPSFSKNTTEYTVKVGYNVTSILISAKTNNEDATKKVSGSKDLAVGENQRSVTVTAPSGDTKTYTITIIRANSDGTSVDPGNNDNVNVTIGETKYTFVDDLSSLDIPDGFQLEIETYKDKSIPVVQSIDKNINIVFLSKATDNTTAWFFYNKDDESFTETGKITAQELFDFTNVVSERIRDEVEPEEVVDPGEEIDPGFTQKIDSDTFSMLIIIAGTLALLLIVILILQIKIIKDKKKSKKLN